MEQSNVFDKLLLEVFCSNMLFLNHEAIRYKQIYTFDLIDISHKALFYMYIEFLLVSILLFVIMIKMALQINVMMILMEMAIWIF